jgi:sugar/nucleoside kinase (ribokinase family)
MKVVVVGSLTRDTIVQELAAGERTAEKLGGTAYYASNAYARLGASVRIVSRLASADEVWARGQLPAEIDLRASPSPVTTRFENRYRDDQRTQLAGPLAAPIDYFPELVADADWIHLGPLHPQDLHLDWYHASLAPRGLDVQGLVRQVQHGRVIPRAATALASCLSALRWLKAGLDEWRLVLAALDCTETECIARLRDTEVVRTEGRNGGAVLAANARGFSWRPAPVVDGVDPTGAGDVFFAAYLYHRAGRGVPAQDASEAAARWVSDFLLGRT